MQRKWFARSARFPAVFLLVALAGCAGGSDDVLGDGARPSTEPVGGDDNGGTTASAPAEPRSEDAGGAGAPTLSANPGEAWVEVDGERLVYQASGSLFYLCDINAEQILVNFQIEPGDNFSISAAPQGDSWSGLLQFGHGDVEDVSYGVALALVDGTLGIADNEFSYVGTVERREAGATEQTQVDANIAVNCASAGGEPSAVIGSQTYEFPASGAQSFDCTVAPDDIEVVVNRLSVDGLQLAIDGRQESGNWIGSVAVWDGDAKFSSTLAADGEGLVIDGNSVTYQGTFVGVDGNEVDGSVDVTCP